MAGRNRAIRNISNESFALNKSESLVFKNKPCVFLSHSSKDKSAARSIGKYFTDADIDIYFDENDAALQLAVREGDPNKVTSLIEAGLSQSTHIMCLVSTETAESWWVPYELGYAKKSNMPISTLKLKEAVYLPDFLKIGEVLGGIKSLNAYINSTVWSLRYLHESALRSRVALESYSAPRHSLENYLYWNN